jgi:hypothetical protein
MKLVLDSISIEELKKMSETMFEALVKAVVDVDQEIMVVDATMHSDEEMFLLENGSQQENLWGINIYPHEAGTPRFVVFDSMINIRPRQNNRSRSVENPDLQAKIQKIVLKLVTMS